MSVGIQEPETFVFDAVPITPRARGTSDLLDDSRRRFRNNGSAKTRRTLKRRDRSLTCTQIVGNATERPSLVPSSKHVTDIRRNSVDVRIPSQGLTSDEIMISAHERNEG